MTYLEEITDQLACDIATEYLRGEEAPLTAFIHEICDTEVIRTSRAKEIVFELSAEERDHVRGRDMDLDFDDYSSIAFIALEGALHRVFWDMELSTGDPIICERYGDHEVEVDDTGPLTFGVESSARTDRVAPLRGWHEGGLFWVVIDVEF